MTRVENAGGDLDEQALDLTDLLTDLSLRRSSPSIGSSTRCSTLPTVGISGRRRHIINGGCSDDGFESFRAWLIAQGERVYREALDDPETLVAVAPSQRATEAESMLYAAADAYKLTAGT